MVNIPQFRHRRDQDTLFLQRTWYTIQLTGTGRSGIHVERENPAISITEMGRSAENWQLFPQGGRYFIRNWEWGSNFQLGLTRDENRSVPAMFPRSGSVSQQWTVRGVNGGYEFTNGLLGNGTKLTLEETEGQPVMRKQGNGVWNITRNERYASFISFHGCVTFYNRE
jgi:hypothetical protein